MGRAGITIEKVAEAVSSLRASGKPTTTRTVQLELCEGSNTTISRLLEELGAKNGAKPSALPSMPEVVQRRFAGAAYSMWEASSKAAAEHNLETETQCEQRVHTVSTQLVLEREERKRLDMELCATGAELAASKQREHFLQQEVSMPTRPKLVPAVMSSSTPCSTAW